LLQFVDRDRGPQPGFDRSLDPGVIERGVLAREVDPALGRDDFVVQQCLLAGVE
jgi:hypothetical protein